MIRRFLTLTVVALLVFADQTPQTLPFTQNWSNAGLITVNDNWSGVVGIEGYLGQDITTSTGADPQLLLGVSAAANDLDVIANQTSTAITNGGVAEFDTLPNPTIALQGSGTADAPYLLISLNTAGQGNINVAYNLRDIDATADNAVQPVALQYRVGNSGNFTNVPAGFVADATTGPSLATLVTPVSATLPAAANSRFASSRPTPLAVTNGSALTTSTSPAPRFPKRSRSTTCHCRRATRAPRATTSRSA